MKHESAISRYVALYALLIRLHPEQFRKRFGAEMEQLFRDRLLGSTEERRPVALLAVWMCAETTVELVRQHVTIFIQRYRELVRSALATLLLLMVPAVAMEFTGEVDWTLFDFVFAGTAIFGTGLALQLVARQRRGTLYRCALCLALVSALALGWINGAVGLIGSESADFSALYGGVLAVGLAGAALSRLRPRGMEWTMAAMASVHGAIGFVALWTGRHGGSTAEAFEIVGVTGLFMLPFLIAGLMFRQTWRGQSSSTP